MSLDKLKISALLIIPIVSGAATGGGMWIAIKDRVAAVEAVQAEIKPRVEKVEMKSAEHDTGIAVLGTKIDAVLESLGRMEDKFGTKR